MRPLITALLFSAALPASAATLTVTTADDVVDTGDAFLSLREAIADASAGDTIEFDFTLDGATITTGETLVFGKTLTVDASGLPAGIRLDAQLNHRLLDIQSGNTVTIAGASLLNGRTTNQNGGGARVFGNLTLRQCLVSGCIGGFGGGLFASGNVVVDCENCTFSGNKCRNGGSAVAGNSGADFIFRHCTIYNNTGFNSNMVIGAGAGGYFVGAGTTTTLGHTVFGENRDGAGNLFTGFYAAGASTTSEGYNCLDQPGGAGALPTDLVSTDPMLGPLEYWGGKTECHRPLAGSPLIDAGNPSIASPPVRDGVGAKRTHGSTIDIGAIERGVHTFEQWCEFHGVEASPLADDDSDGSAQIEEYIFGTNPDDSGDFHRPEIVFGTDLIRLNSRINSDNADCALINESSQSLGAWFGATPRPTQSLPVDGITDLTHTYNRIPQRRFVRIRSYLGRPQ